MKCVENQIFYHIQHSGSWNPGEVYFVGQTKNNFVSYFDNYGKVVTDHNTGTLYSVNTVASHMKDYVSNNRKSAPLDKFYHYDINKTLYELADTLDYYLRLSREFIFEEIRKEFFPDLPSRYRCLWVIPDSKDAINYWWNTLGRSGRLLKLSLTGKLHRANQQYLTLRTDRMNFIRQEAFKYWAGTSGANAIEEECLFEGFAEVLDIVEPSSMGLK